MIGWAELDKNRTHTPEVNHTHEFSLIRFCAMLMLLVIKSHYKISWHTRRSKKKSKRSWWAQRLSHGLRNSINVGMLLFMASRATINSSHFLNCNCSKCWGDLYQRYKLFSSNGEAGTGSWSQLRPFMVHPPFQLDASPRRYLPMTGISFVFPQLNRERGKWR